ncbi:hypothetical protein ACMFMG_006548 [Clarireedia jacksonii]
MGTCDVGIKSALPKVFSPIAIMRKVLYTYSSETSVYKTTHNSENVYKRIYLPTSLGTPEHTRYTSTDRLDTTAKPQTICYEDQALATCFNKGIQWMPIRHLFTT